jgi:hypothetical protein
MENADTPITVLRRPDRSMTPTRLEFTRRPSVVAYMLRALVPSSGRVDHVPALTARWIGCDPSAGDIADFQRLAGIDDAHGFSLLFPQVLSFPLQMAVLTHPRFPQPTWNALQVRNRLQQHRPFAGTGELTLETRVAAQRVLPKCVEIDLHSTARRSAVLLWEGVTTFYYRGRFAAPEEAASPVTAPATPAPVVDRWTTGSSRRWRFARLTGDFNGIHGWDWYARLFGFPRAFQHPQRALAECLARLQAVAAHQPQQLEIWLKGPVPYGCAVQLHAASGNEGTPFALVLAGETRPALVGRWSCEDAAEPRRCDA